ncbi:MAG: RIP metalloprotease RseP [Gammaproteobacteria bacterium]|nr:RIP metalloprotease RseP [Gammaproteobacteria bacterium]
MSFIISVLAFFVALGILITIHEYGHFWVARKMGVRVLRFSIGFGKPLFSWQGRDGTEFVVAAIPLGGYVKMLDEREGEVAADELDRAFNRKSVYARIAIVVAGPLANFILAIAAYWLMFVIGISSLLPIVAEPPKGTPAFEARVHNEDQLISVNGRSVASWEQARLLLMEGLLDTDQPLPLRVERALGGSEVLSLDLQGRSFLKAEGDPLRQLGLSPWWPQVSPQIGRVLSGGAAEKAGLQVDDLILSADGVHIESWQAWVKYVRARPEQRMELRLKRNGDVIVLFLTPALKQLKTQQIGYIGAAETRALPLRQQRLMTEVSYSPLEALQQAVEKTWQMSAITLQMLGKLLVGDASLKNISGPLTIAQYAGQSASVGLDHYLSFLALISISLGVLNLLPIPVLDGGHLLFFFIEAVKRRPLSEQTQMIGQQIGMFLLICLMGLAFYNDLARLLG